MISISSILSGHTIRHWWWIRLLVSFAWPVLFLVWLLARLRFVGVNILPQTRGNAQTQMGTRMLLHFWGCVGLTFVGFLVGKWAAPHALQLFGMTAVAFVGYTYVLFVPLVWWGIDRYIRVFLPAHEQATANRIRLWLIAVSLVSGFWIAIAGYVLFS